MKLYFIEYRYDDFLYSIEESQKKKMKYLPNKIIRHHKNIISEKNGKLGQN